MPLRFGKTGSAPRAARRRAVTTLLATLTSALVYLCTEAVWAATESGSPEEIVEVTPVSGPSLLARLRTGVASTSFGRIGRLGSVPEEVRRRYEPVERLEQVSGSWLKRGFVLSGADLYRLNCRSCHAAGGEGLPPAIPALLDPIRALSPELLQKRMEERGRSIGEEFAKKLALRAELTLRHRLLEGGAEMPPFKHLVGKEIDALLGYLESLAGVPPNDRTELRVEQPVERVGEHVIKATCLICHDATKRWGRSAADREIPALGSIPEDYAVREFVRKVRTGSPECGNHRGRMPLFNYLTEDELAAAYMYLTAYPPEAEERDE